MSAVEVFMVPVLAAVRERLTPDNGRMDTLAQWVTDGITVQAHRWILRNADGSYKTPTYTIEFVNPGERYAEMPDRDGPGLLEALPLLLAAITHQRVLDDQVIGGRDSGQ